MSSALRLPRRPAPPHDPWSLLLAPWLGAAPREGFRLRSQRGVVVDPCNGALVLAPRPDSAARLTDPTGSFGGHRLPPHLAAGPDGTLWLLNTMGGGLRVFDPCRCRFERAPGGLHLAPVSDACQDLPRRGRPFVPLTRLASPSALAICDGRLLLADSGHARVLVFALAGLVPRGALGLPPAQAAALASPWWPDDLAFDGRGQLWVLDSHHGRIDRFDVQGRWVGPALSVPGARHLMADGQGRLLVTTTTDHAAVVPAVAGSSDAVYLEFDAGDAETDWQQLVFDTLPAGGLLDIDAALADTALGVAQLPLLPEASWRRCAAGVGEAQTGRPLPLRLGSGRVLRLRLTPRGPWLAAAPTLRATAAQAWRFAGPPPAVPERLPLAADAPRLPAAPAVAVPWWLDADGRLLLGCEDPLAGLHWCAFDAAGRALGERPAPVRRFLRSGQALTQRLDSVIDECTWHRVVLDASIPTGCTVELRTCSANIALDDDEVDTLPESAWCTRAVLGTTTGTRHDALITSPPGRFLWLQMLLRGDGTASPRIRAIDLEFPRISLRRYLPAVYGADPLGADFTDRFLALFDTTLRSIEQPLDALASFVDPMSAPAAPGRDFLAWLAGWLGESPLTELPEDQRRHLLKHAARLYACRGTPDALRRQLWLLLGFDQALARCADVRGRRTCRPQPLNCAPPPRATPAEPPPLVLEHFKLRRWLHAGRGRLGQDAELWGDAIVNRTQLGVHAQAGGRAGAGAAEGTRLVGTPDPLRDPLLVHAHRASVFVPASVLRAPALDRALKRLLAREVPAHVAVDLRYVAPRMQLGCQAMVGLDAVIARTPQGVQLADASQPPPPDTLPAMALGPSSRLAQGTVLTADPALGPAQGPSPRVGDRRVGPGHRLR